MTPEAINTLTHAFISSRLDYCNVLYCGIAEGLLSRLQSVQNAAACLVTGLGRREHITSVLQQLHWLPVHQRVQFKLATLVYRSLAILHRPTCPTNVASLRLLVRTLYDWPTLGHVYLTALTTATAIVVLPLLVLACGIVCHCSFNSRMFLLIVLKNC